MSDNISIQSIFRNYEVHFSDTIGDILNELQDQKNIFLIDSNIYKIYENNLKILDENNIIIIEANEQNKTAEYCLSLINVLLEKKVKKSTTLVAIGGGVIQDIVSFISSILFRGIEWMFIPTTLLAQGDSCIGSKSSINFRETKNLLGTFNPPKKIFIDINFLFSISKQDIKSGIGEMLHYFYYADSGLIGELIQNYTDFLEDPVLLRKFIFESLNIKKGMIEIDEFDKGPRRIFNYGHTFGHALESLTDFKINHGQAVTVGMDLANYISLHLNFISDREYNERLAELSVNFPDFSIEDYNLEDYYSLLKKDKKNINENLTCILSKGKGNLFIHELVLDRTIKDLMQVYFKVKFSKQYH